MRPSFMKGQGRPCGGTSARGVVPARVDSRRVYGDSAANRNRTGREPLDPAAFCRHKAAAMRDTTAPEILKDNAAPPANSLARRGRAPPHVRDHLAPGRRQDHADREAAAVRRRDQSRRAGEGQGRPAQHALGLDEDRARARHLGRHLGDDVRVRRPGLQPARHAGPRGLFRGHLSHADRGRLGGDGDRCRQGHRGAHAKAVRGLPPARHSDHHLHQQDGSREPRSVRPAGRDREDAGARHRAGDLADRPRPRFRRHLRHRHRRRAAAGVRRENRRRAEDRHRGPGEEESESRRQGDQGRAGTRLGGLQAVRPRGVSAKAT